jgi:hypothetical protein
MISGRGRALSSRNASAGRYVAFSVRALALQKNLTTSHRGEFLELPMQYPFARGQTYTFRALRDFERDLLHVRQENRAVSAQWRVPNSLQTNEWQKLREETFPIKLLADHKGYPDHGTFCLTPSGFPGVDAEIFSGRDRFDLQITIADPIWPGQKHGGHDFRLKMEALNSAGVVHGSGDFRREGDLVVCNQMVKDVQEGADACRKALVAALERKSSMNRDPNLRLLIHAREHFIQLFDDGFSTVAAQCVEAFRNRADLPFAHVYFVDEGQFAEF